MDGFKRSKKRPEQPVQPDIPPSPKVQRQPVREGRLPDDLQLPDIRLDDGETNTSVRRKPPRWLYAGLAVIVIGVMLLGGLYLWYQAQLGPVNPADDAVQRVEITEGSSLSHVAQSLEKRGIIRSSLAFKVFVNLEGKQGALKVGTCNLTPAYSAAEILDKLTAGCHDFMSVTFYPGATLETSLYAKTRAEAENETFKDMSIRASLKDAGFSDDEITAAFSAHYDTPLFMDKPADADYEGYIFGETYFVDTDATAEEVLQVAFDHMLSIVRDNDLVGAFKIQGLNLYEGITLASIVGRELDCEGKPTEERQQTCHTYQQRIAQVFYNRLAAGMKLGSDVTSIYASDKLRVSSSIDVDSPYNTRKYTGLPPGPIATPGKLALLSVAHPTKSDDLYFLAGDDGLIYFAKDNAGHEANIVNHCKIYCGDL